MKEKDEWIDFVDGKFVDLDFCNLCSEEEIKEDWERSNSHKLDGLFAEYPKKALYNWTDRAIIMARLLWS